MLNSSVLTKTPRDCTALPPLWGFYGMYSPFCGGKDPIHRHDEI